MGCRQLIESVAEEIDSGVDIRDWSVLFGFRQDGIREVIQLGGFLIVLVALNKYTQL
jgi:hypothetical protein